MRLFGRKSRSFTLRPEPGPRLGSLPEIRVDAPPVDEEEEEAPCPPDTRLDDDSPPVDVTGRARRLRAAPARPTTNRLRAFPAAVVVCLRASKALPSHAPCLFALTQPRCGVVAARGFQIAQCKIIASCIPLSLAV